MIRQLFGIYEDSFTCSIHSKQNTIKPQKPSHWCCCCHYGMRVKTALLCNKATFVGPILLLSSFMETFVYVSYIFITELIKYDFKERTAPLFISATIISIIFFLYTLFLYNNNFIRTLRTS